MDVGPGLTRDQYDQLAMMVRLGHSPFIVYPVDESNYIQGACDVYHVENDTLYCDWHASKTCYVHGLTVYATIGDETYYIFGTQLADIKHVIIGDVLKFRLPVKLK